MNSRTRVYNLIARGVVAALAAAAASNVQAQSSAAAGTGVELEEVIVTAQRRESVLQDVPISIAVLSQADIQRQGAVDLFGLSFSVPNLAVFENANISGRTNVTIRGVPGRTGVYVDDVFVGDSSGYNGLLLDVERIEVLRGPQGTLFGRNSIAGAINTLTRKPGDDPFGMVSLRAGSYGTFYGGAVAGGPLLDDGKVAGKISGAYLTSDGPAKLHGGPSVNGEDEYALAGQLRFRPSDAWDILLSADYSNLDDVRTGYSDAYTDYSINNAPGAVFINAQRDGNPYDDRLPNPNVKRSVGRENTGVSLNADWTTDIGTLTSITAYRDLKFDYVRDGDNTEFDIIAGKQPVTYDQFSQELRLASASGQTFEWQVGAYYFTDSRESNDSNNLGEDYLLQVIPVPQLAPLLPPMVPGGIPGALTIGRLYASPLLQQITGIAPVAPVLGNQTTYDSNEIESIAGFGSFAWRFADQWTLQGGLRYTSEQIKATYGRTISGQLIAFVPEVPTQKLDSGWDGNTSPMVSISYKPVDNITTYATYSQGYQSGGFNLAPAEANPPPDDAQSREFEPETVDNYELGFKSFLFENRMMLNVALFDMSYDNFQRSFYTIDPVTGAQFDTFNTNASIWGFEIETAFRPIEGMDVTFSYGYQDSQYDNYKNAPVNSFTVPSPPGGVLTTDLTGEPLPFTPKNSAALGVQYVVPVTDDWSVRLTGDLQYRSSYLVADGIDDIREVDDTTLLNLSVGVENSAGWLLVARLNNATDEQFTTGLDYNNFVGTVYRSQSTPQIWTFEIQKSFGGSK